MTDRVLRFPSRDVLDAARVLSSGDAEPVELDRAILALGDAVQQAETIPASIMRAAALRFMCRDLSPRATLLAARILAGFDDAPLRTALLEVVCAADPGAVAGDDVMLQAVKTVLRGRVHFAQLSPREQLLLIEAPKTG